VQSDVLSFGDRLSQTFADYGQLCVGIDPHSWLLSDWNLPDTADGAESFGRTVVAAAAGQAGIVKPQVAFFERFGSAGFVALERVLADARAAGLLVIGDAKRGDLGTSGLRTQAGEQARRKTLAGGYAHLEDARSGKQVLV